MNKQIFPREYLFIILTRIGGASPKQLQELCRPVMSRSLVYYHLKKLIQHGYAERLTHPSELKFAYRGTEKAFKSEYEFHEATGFGRPRPKELGHTLLVTETLVTLSKYQNVSGIAAEHELCSSKVDSFTGGRKPDAIIQLTNSYGVYELAIEVEKSLKSKERINGILDSYEACFERDLQCHGVIIVCGKKDVFESYSKEILKREEKFQKRVLITTPEGILKLRENVYGPLDSKVKIIWDLRRTQSGERIEYISDLSRG